MNARHPLAVLLPLFLAACGKPPPPEPPPSDFPVAAVVAMVTREAVEERVELVGTVRATDTVELRSELEARVSAAEFTEGGAVEAGQVLFRLDPRREEARLAEAQARLERAAADRARGDELLARQTIPPQEMDRLVEAARTAAAAVELARANLADATIAAPFAGLVGERRAVPGQFVSRGDPLATLTRMDPLEIDFRVPERFAARVAAGQAVRFRAPAWPDETFEARVQYLEPALDADSRSLRVKAGLPNPGLKLRPGMFGTIDLVFATREAALLIPEGALINRGDATLVVRVGADHKAEFRPVVAGERLAGRVEITGGLAEGDRVIVEGHQKTRPGATVIATAGSRRFGVEPDPPPGAPAAAAAADQPAAGQPADATR
jgi:membrane fusion protein, multidrug efflux system